MKEHLEQFALRLDLNRVCKFWEAYNRQRKDEHIDNLRPDITIESQEMIT